MHEFCLLEVGDAKVYHGSCLDVLPTLPDNSVDSIVTDPPYELGFMGKKWDSTGIAFNPDVWLECLRVLKPGGHLLAFGGSRTWHRLAVAIEDAGFEVRDSIAWLYGSGFPKSLDVSKAIDKASDEAKQWQGWGTALKPAFEPVVVARKPLTGTVAANVLEWGVGGLNIDGTRIAHASASDFEKHAKSVADTKSRGGVRDNSWKNSSDLSGANDVSTAGRWPANVMLDEYTAALVDEQSGVSKDGVAVKRNRNASEIEGSYEGGWRKLTADQGFGGSGGASRFFYVAKASKRDRNQGLDDLPTVSASEMVERKDGSAGMDKPRAGAGRTSGAKNFHPTVKPTTLMRYLVKLVTPPGGTVLDPFTGSGSTGKAAILEGFTFIGIELTEDYLPIIEGRLNHATQVKDTEESQPTQGTIF